MAARVFTTRRGRITVTDEMLIYEQRLNHLWRVSHRVYRVARVDIDEVRIVTYAYWLRPVRIDVLVHHHGGLLTIPSIGRKTAEGLRAALGF